MSSTDLNDKAEIKPEVVFIGKIMERVMDGRMLVPKFQRPFVWRQSDMLGLLDSVLKGYPIGSLLVWETETEVSSIESIGPIQVTPHSQGLIGYILDGHQRVATLLGTLMFGGDSKSPRDGIDWKVYCDLDKMEFMREPSGGLEAKHFPVRKLLSTSGYLQACREIQSKVADEERAKKLLEAADILANAFRNYTLPIISVSQASMDTAVQVFSRLNLTGRKMSPDQMVSALTYKPKEFHLAGELDTLMEEISRQGFGGLDRIFPLRATLAALNRDIYAHDFADLLIKPELRRDLPAAMESTKKNVRLAIDRLRLWGITSDRLLPYGLQLVFLAEFFRRRPNPSAEVSKVLERWFWVTSFIGWFGGVNSTQVQLALTEMRDLADSNNLGAFKLVDLDKMALAFPSRFDTRSARVHAYLLYLGSLTPRSLRDARALDPGALHAELGSKALAYVVASGLPKELSASPANRMYVDRDHRGQALAALQELDDQQLDKVLVSHGFPSEARGHLRNNERAALINCRLRCLIDGEREFMKRYGVTPPKTDNAPPIADSDLADSS